MVLYFSPVKKSLFATTYGKHTHELVEFRNSLDFKRDVTESLANDMNPMNLDISGHAQYQLALRYKKEWSNGRIPANVYVTPVHGSLVWISGELMSNCHLIKSDEELNP